MVRKVKKRYLIELDTDDKKKIDKFKKKFNAAIEGTGNIYLPAFVTRITDLKTGKVLTDFKYGSPKKTLKIKLYCRIFGHDFRGLTRQEGESEYTSVVPSDYCRNCGLHKEELKLLRMD